MNFKISSKKWFQAFSKLFSLCCIASILMLLTAAGSTSIISEDDGEKKCSCKTRYPATGKYDAAFKHALPGGDNFGTCWSCPRNYKRTLHGLESNKACVISTKAKHIGYYGCKKKYGKNAFFDPRKGGECWTCPSGFHRTWDPVTAKRACSKSIFGPFKTATFRGKNGCDSGFGDMIDGGTCWTCPPGGKRTIFHVKSNRACEVFKPATHRGTHPSKVYDECMPDDYGRRR